MLKNVISVIVGIITASVLIAVVEVVSHKIYPPPTSFDFTDKEALKSLMNSLPKGALLMVILAHSAGTFVGGLVAAFISDNRRIMFAIITGGVVLIMGIANLLIIPHPVWFVVADLLVYIPFAFLGGMIALKLKP